MNVVIAVLLIVLVLAVGLVLVLALVIAGIQGDERRMGLNCTPRTRTGAFARRVLGFHATPPATTCRARGQARR